MARTVRKVSRTSTKNQQKESKLSKKWWIVIASTVGAVVLGLAIFLIVYFATQEDEYISDKVYFNEVVENSNGNEVSFIKDNYQTLIRYIEAEKYDHLLVFAYDGNAFYADEEADNYNEEYDNLITYLADLQYEVNVAKENGVNIELFIVDVSIDNYSNVDILLDTTYFGGLYSSEQTIYTPALIYNQEGEFMSDVEIDEKSYIISTAAEKTILSPSFINNAINYIKTL